MLFFIASSAAVLSAAACSVMWAGALETVLEMGGRGLEVVLVLSTLFSKNNRLQL